MGPRNCWETDWGVRGDLLRQGELSLYVRRGPMEWPLQARTSWGSQWETGGAYWDSRSWEMVESTRSWPIILENIEWAKRTDHGWSLQGVQQTSYTGPSSRHRESPRSSGHMRLVNPRISSRPRLPLLQYSPRMYKCISEGGGLLRFWASLSRQKTETTA